MAKTFILMRHGCAPDGALTEEGTQQVRSVARQMIEAGIQPDIILHSPLPRVAATACAVAEEYRVAGKEVATVGVDKNLSADEKNIPLVLSGLNGERVALLVSHKEDIVSALSKISSVKFFLPQYANAIVFESESDDWRSVVASPALNKKVCVLKPKP